MPSVFLSWTDHGRSRDLAEKLSITNVVISSRQRFLMFRYAEQMFRTVRTLKSLSPDRVIVMQPPPPAAIACQIYRRLINPNVVLIGDLHTGFFEDRKWRWFINIAYRIFKDGGVIATNRHLAERVPKSVRNVWTLHDLIRAEQSGSVSKGFILCPLSYAPDEPLEELLDAAVNTPHISWVWTGNAPAKLRASAPKNIRFAGFVSNAEYRQLLSDAQIILAATTRNFTMQRAGYEAMILAKPLIISDKNVLRDFFEDAAVYFTPDASAIAKAANEAFSKSKFLSQEMIHVRTKRAQEQDSVLRSIDTFIGNGDI